MKVLYKKVKEMPVDDYLDLYNKFVDDITQRNVPTMTITPSSTYTISKSPFC